ncbi:MAG TPA: TIGR03936 family radical SAM-associated protein [Candidatus Brocadiaceae bacterium]
MRFTKSGEIRFISHHDLMKVFERAIRRANIPVAMSKGFNPHPKMSIPMALGVGIAGKEEILELELEEIMPFGLLVDRLGEQLPREIQILSAETIPGSQKSQVRDVAYEVVFKEHGVLKTLKVSEFLQQPAVIVNRIKDGSQKQFNIRPSIQDVATTSTSLIFTIKMTPGGMARPEEVVYALLVGEKKELFEITRTKVNLLSSA